MSRMIPFTIATFIAIHGLIHTMGLVAYWPIAVLPELPYKTTLLNGRFHLGTLGMRFFSVVWLITAVGFATAAYALVSRQSWWFPVMVATVLLSLLITILDWESAFRGAIFNFMLIAGLAVVGGLRWQPQPFAVPAATPPLTMVPVPTDLPPPVARFYEAIAGDRVPVVETAVMTARGELRFAGVTFPTRFRFTHNAGQDYRHDIESTFFNIPLMTATETYIDGHARMETPGGIMENNAQVDASANLVLWSESLLLPSVLVLDERVRWEVVDAHTARLIVPFEEDWDELTAVFNPTTGLIDSLEAMRYRDTELEKTKWRVDILSWHTQNGLLLPATMSITWVDESSPWLTATIEQISYNTPVAIRIKAKS